MHPRSYDFVYTVMVKIVVVYHLSENSRHFGQKVNGKAIYLAQLENVRNKLNVFKGT